MLQFILSSSSQYSLAESAQMAIEGGCGWIQYSAQPPCRDTALELMELCRENEVIFIIDHDVEMVNELKVSGVHLAKNDMKAQEARELLGPHAIIGVDVDTPEEVILLRPADIDYVVLAPFQEKYSVEDYAKFVSVLEEKGCDMPVVARGNITPKDAADLLAVGVKGIAVGSMIADADSPATAVESYLDLTNRR